MLRKNTLNKNAFSLLVGNLLTFLFVCNANLLSFDEIYETLDIIDSKSLLDKSFMKYPDSLNQWTLNSNSNSIYSLLNLDNIPLYSLFDGNYNYTFLRFLDLPCGEKSDSLQLADIKDSSSNNFLLYSSNFNGLFASKIFRKKNSLYIRLRPSFESSGGYYYSAKNSENILNLKFLENSSFQNLDLDLSGGFVNNSADISINLIYKDSKLYVPVRTADSTHYMQNFNKYDTFLSYLKFGNTFNENFSLNGNFFFKKFLRNYGSSFDTSYVPIGKFNSKMEIDEFSYGGNLMGKYNLLGFSKPIAFNINYSQNIFLYSNESDQSRVRTESEQMRLGMEQEISLLDNFRAFLKLDYKSRAILYTEFGFVPENKSSVDYSVNFNYLISKNEFELNYSSFTVFPFVSNYFELHPSQSENPDLLSEKWHELQFSYSSDFYGNEFEFKIILDDGHNVNYPLNTGISEYIYNSDGSVVAAGFEVNTKIKLLGIDFQSGTKANIREFSDEKIELIARYKLPKFYQSLTIGKKFEFGLLASLRYAYQSGLPIYNFAEGIKSKTSGASRFDLYLNQAIFSQNIFIAIRNLTNQYYEFNYSVPEPGINFLLGLALRL